MGYEIVPRRPAGLDRRTSKELERVQREAALERAALAVRLGNSKLEAQTRIGHAYDLAEYSFQRAHGLSRLVTIYTRDNPGLEMIGRVKEEMLAMKSDMIISNYLTQ